MLEWSFKLYANVSTGAYKSQSVGRSPVIFRKSEKMILLNLSAGLFVLGWYLVANRFFISKILRLFVKNFDDICLPLSVKSELSGPYKSSPFVVKANEMSHSVMNFIETVTVNFVNRLAITGEINSLAGFSRTDLTNQVRMRRVVLSPGTASSLWFLFGV